MIRLPYNSARLNDDLWRAGRNLRMSIRSEHYRDTKMVQWLEEHVGKMCEKKSGESWYGDGWQIKNEIIKSVSEEFSIEFDPHVVIEKELSEELQTDFLLRFS